MKNNLARAIKQRTKRFVYLLIIILMPGLCIAADNVLISEVLYDPVGTESGGEAVELYNPTGADVDISGYVIATESSAGDATVPAGTVLGAGRYYLIADSGWSTLRDDAGWPEADHEEAITMSNTNAGVALVHPNSTILDALGWGDAAGIDAGLYEATPALPVTAGNSLARVDVGVDTDDNSADFAEAGPDLQNSSSTGGGGGAGASNSSESIDVSVSVSNSAPGVASVLLLGDEDDATPGVQRMPLPDASIEVGVSAEITDADGISSIGSVVATVTGPSGEKGVVLNLAESISNTTAVYNGSIQMEFHEQAGAYNVTVTANDSASSGTSSGWFEYLSMAAISVDATALLFNGAVLGGSAEVNGDFALSTSDAPTVRNTGNTGLDVGLYGTDLVDGANSIGISNIKYSFDNDYGSPLSGTLAESMQVHALGLVNAADSVMSLGFQLYVPPETANGNYTGQITVVAVSS
jgi:hypothetical protein